MFSHRCKHRNKNCGLVMMFSSFHASHWRDTWPCRVCSSNHKSQNIIVTKKRRSRETGCVTHLRYSALFLLQSNTCTAKKPPIKLAVCKQSLSLDAMKTSKGRKGCEIHLCYRSQIEFSLTISSQRNRSFPTRKAGPFNPTHFARHSHVRHTSGAKRTKCSPAELPTYYHSRFNQAFPFGNFGVKWRPI